MNKTTGKLIVVEGASDGIGKTTQYNLLHEHLKADGHKIITHHFPTYYSYQGKAVEKYLAGEYGEPENLSPFFINSLYANDRAITWHMKLRKEFEKGHTILLDRYTTSSLIYQSALISNKRQKQSFLNFVDDYEYHKLGIGRPDLVIFLHAPFDLVTKLRTSRKENDGVSNDIHEHNLEFLRKVYDNSMFVAKHFNWTMIDCSNSSRTKILTPDQIHQKIYQSVSKLYE